MYGFSFFDWLHGPRVDYSDSRGRSRGSDLFNFALGFFLAEVFDVLLRMLVIAEDVEADLIVVLSDGFVLVDAASGEMSTDCVRYW